MITKKLQLIATISVLLCCTVSADDIHFIGAWYGGFFSSFNCVLNHLSWCEKNKKTPVVYWDKRSLYYVPEGFNGSHNAWEYYFTPVSSVKAHPSSPIDLQFTAYQTPVEFSVDELYDDTRKRASDLISKYIRINPIILEKINKVYSKHMRGKKTIGIHIRGTDKGSEEKPVTPEKIIATALQYADADTQFLLATDEQKILNRMVKLLEGYRVIYYECYRSNNGTPIHTGQIKASKAQVGEDVLVETVLLSRCDLLIHTLSNVSSVALYFNHSLPHVVARQDGLPTEPPFHR